MDTFSHEGETQATQILEHVLGGGMDAAARRTNDQPYEEDVSNGKDLSDSLPSVRIAPRYHYHGLANTQTESQVNDDDDMNQSSQKENIDSMVAEVKAVANSRSESPRPSIIRTPVRPPRVDLLSHSSGKSKKAKPTNGKAVAYASPRVPIKIGAGTKPPSRYTRQATRNCPDPPDDTFSQDSFAGPFEEDVQQRLIAAAPQFEVPLSDLRHLSSVEDHAEDSENGDQADMFAYTAQSRGVARAPSPSPIILVAATPSNTDGSQSQSDTSQNFDEINPAQDPNTVSTVQPMVTSDDPLPSQPSTPSSSYARYVEGVPDPESLAEEPAPAHALEATQPSTQTEDWPGFHTATAGTAATAGTTVPSHLTGTTNTTDTGGKHLNYLSNKRWRLQGFPQHTTLPPQTAARIAHTYALPQVSEVALEETQPSNEDESTPFVRRGFAPRYRKAPEPATAQAPPHPIQTPVREDDNMDIVPDSEPLRAVPSEEIRMRNKDLTPTKTSPPQKVFRPISPGSDPNPNSGEIVPDSLMVDEELAGVQNKCADSGKGTIEDDEDDIPLAVSIKGAKGTRLMSKSKGVAKLAEPTSTTMLLAKRPKSNDAVPMSEVARGKQRATAPVDADATIKDFRKEKTVLRSTVVRRRSSDVGIVPSSLPEQDAASDLPPKDETAEPTIKTTQRTTRSLTSSSKTKKTTTKRRRLSSDPEDERGQTESGEDLPLPKVEDEEEGTEPADEDYMDGDFEEEVRAGPSTRKRKRTKVAQVPRTARTTRTTRTTKAATPAPRKTTKRLRSIASAGGSRSAIGDPTRVFALWKQDGHYYSGIVFSHQPNGHYLIKFDDDTEGQVNINQMRRADLRVGDDVIVAHGSSRSVKVVSVDKLESDDMITVKKDGEPLEVALQDIRLAHKTISYAWKDRQLQPDAIVAVVKPPKPSPSPSKQSVLSGTSMRSIRRKIFTNTGFIITMSAGNENWEQDKQTMVNAITASGGLVIDDFSSIIRMEGTYSADNTRWVIKQKEVQWIGGEDIQRVFLLADDATQKAKYLTALALGIPCLSLQWITDSIEVDQEKDWMPYLLPQGFTEALGARVSQFVDLDWGNSIHHLTEITSNAVAAKVFKKLNILCLGEELMPTPTIRRGQDASHAVPSIIVSMGAERVEAVADLHNASSPAKRFDYVVIKDHEHYFDELDGSRTVDVAWIKHCLIAGRRLSLPEWSQP